MSRKLTTVIACVFFAVCAVNSVHPARSAEPDLARKIAALESRLASVEQEAGIQSDINAIRKLQYTYGYYLDKGLNTQVVALFTSNDPSAEIGGRGIYRGHDGVSRLYTGIFRRRPQGDGPVFGNALEHMQLQDVVDVAPDRRTAKGRFRAFVMQVTGYPDNPLETWQSGIYENDYVKEDGVWKIHKLTYKQVITCLHIGDCKDSFSYMSGPSKDLPPDAPSTPYHPFPEVTVIPFHYPHPVTGKPIPAFEDSNKFWCGAAPCKDK
jgi:SnoaL-like domain